MFYYFSFFLIFLTIVLSVRSLFIPNKIKGKRVSFENFVVLALIYGIVLAGFGLIYFLLEIKGMKVLSDTHTHVSQFEAFERMSSNMYFSAVTLFSVGYGDIAPIGIGRAIAVVEALIGYTIPAAFVTRIVMDHDK